MTILDYLLTNFYMGAGIAADVYFATLASFRLFGERANGSTLDNPELFNKHLADSIWSNPKNYKIKQSLLDQFLALPTLLRWITYNTITHTLFPLLGMYLVITGIAIWKPLTSLLFSVGAVMLGLFLYHLINEHNDRPTITYSQEKHNNSTLFDKHVTPVIGRMNSFDPLLLVVLGVSTDAINSGLAKAADTRSWSLFLLLLSFPLVGLVVGFWTWIAGKQAKAFLEYYTNIQNTNNDSSINKQSKKLAKFELIALGIEIYVLGYFFWRSVASAISPYIDRDIVEQRGSAWVVSAISLFIITLIRGKLIYNSVQKNAIHSFIK
ncbi:hypothetical protein [Flavobacterium sp.]|uniref:hypothetical protein n=1 Tax=Flavobacterium sp. TaxID=239 RepID=UPI0039189184